MEKNSLQILYDPEELNKKGQKLLFFSTLFLKTNSNNY